MQGLNSALHYEVMEKLQMKVQNILKKLDIRFLIPATIFLVLYLTVLFTFVFTPEIYQGIGFFENLIQQDNWAFMNKIYPTFITVPFYLFLGLSVRKSYSKAAKVLYIIAGVCLIVTTFAIIASQFGIYDGFTPFPV